MNQTTIRETARESIEAEVQQAWEHVVGTPCYQWLMVDPDGACWWSEQTNKNNISAAEFNGDCPGYVRLECFGTPGVDNGLQDFEQFEIRKANAGELAVITEYLDGSDETDIDIDDVTWRMDKHGDECGDAGSWYTVTDEVLAWNEGFWCDTSPGDIFETALRVLSEIPFGFFDDETMAFEFYLDDVSLSDLLTKDATKGSVKLINEELVFACDKPEDYLKLHTLKSSKGHAHFADVDWSRNRHPNHVDVDSNRQIAEIIKALREAGFKVE